MNGTFVFSAEPSPPEKVASSHFNENGRAVGAFGEIIGQSRSWRQITKQIEMVAPTEATVLILGETGTGKELIARELHQRSRRKTKPLVRVNCACLPKALYESAVQRGISVPNCAHCPDETTRRSKRMNKDRPLLA